MSDGEGGLIDRYRQIHQRLEELERERKALDAELVEIERQLPEGFRAEDDKSG